MILENACPYENKTVYGPYFHKREGRYYVHIIDPDGNRTSTSYARYLMQIKIGRELSRKEVVDHIDNDPTNDNYENLQVITSSQNRTKDAPSRKMATFTCENCSSEFQRRIWKNRDISSIRFCSRICLWTSRKNNQYGSSSPH